MKTIRRYLANEILSNTVLVFVALLGLFAFFDLIQELGELNKGDYRLSFILLYVLLSVPGHIYETVAPDGVYIVPGDHASVVDPQGYGIGH